MILKELHLTDALGRISIFPPLTHNGEVRTLTWPQVIDISKMRDKQIVGTSGLIKFWKLEKILLRTVAVARAYTFLEDRSRDSTWWPDLMWPRHKNFTTECKIDQWHGMPSFVTLLPFVFELSSKNHRGGKMTPHQGEGLRPAGGVRTPPVRFFTNNRKTAAVGFSPTLSPIFLATFVKVSILGHARSGHQVRSSDHTLQKFTIAPQLQCLREGYDTFWLW